ncbi:MAG: hypothetical protein ACFFDN_51445 [Candidatus Hodarchaeota archaeon]
MDRIDLKGIILKIIGMFLIILGYSSLLIIWFNSSDGVPIRSTIFIAVQLTVPLISTGTVLLLLKGNFSLRTMLIINILVLIFGFITSFIGIILSIAPSFPYFPFWGNLVFWLSIPILVIGFIFLIRIIYYW